MFKETVGGCIVLTLEKMEVVLYDFVVKFKRIRIEMHSHMGQTSGIVGEGPLTFTGNGYRSSEPFEL
ncbi:hypothetical protein [Cyclobacterium qasimii]|uniref:Uncharacterized protein n=1 Tax=Cyclobacterium qasimii M12-11B TaxID=641524 RepID=S7VHK9_9BACT|nr:hypothetical protein [Cyclobacterium qasimii]EPR69017.1 hypothetical protein ADICYQ_1962 [Cyclobacterium qasimii M12-11B]